MNRNIIFLFFFLACTQPSKDQQLAEPKTEPQEKIVDTIEKEIPEPEEKSSQTIDPVEVQGFYYVEKLSYLIPDEEGFLLVDSIRIHKDSVTHIHLADEGMNNWKVKGFPYEVLNLKNLESLWIGFRNFEKLPLEITQLKNLRALDMQHTAVKRLPENIHELENLEELGLLHSGIDSLPISLKNLTKLRVMNLGWTDLEKVPRVLFEMSFLERIVLKHEDEVTGKRFVFDRDEIDSLKKALPNTKISVVDSLTDNF
ncbi:MAG: hypothetical protein AAF388_21850 [Bacteroidota bacterium]